jgi:YHS domain-containing protein
MKRVFPIVIALFLFSFNGSKELRIKHFNVKKGLALQGFDPVTYFTKNKAIKGQKQFEATFNNITYYFSSQQSKELFLTAPAIYEPAYGGWCAYAMGLDGSKVEIDPFTFKIKGQKLYLFYNKFGNNTLKDWNINESVLLQNAHSNWNKIFK